MRNSWQASFQPGVRGHEAGKSCSLKDLAILFRNRLELSVYGKKTNHGTYCRGGATEGRPYSTSRGNFCNEEPVLSVNQPGKDSSHQ